MNKSTQYQGYPKGEIVIYKSPTGPEIQVKLEKDTVWLDAHLIAQLFDVNRPAIVKHINNIYKTGELDKNQPVPFWYRLLLMGKSAMIKWNLKMKQKLIQKI